MTRTKIKHLLIAGVLTMVSAGSASAQSFASLDQKVGDWTVVDEVEYGTIYLDTATVEVVDADVYNIRTRWSFADEQTNVDGQQYSSSVAVRAVNCRSQEMAIVAYADLDGERVVKTSEQPLYAAYWFDINPASILEQIAARTCDLGRRVSRIAAASGS